ncbi:MAG: response regulator [Myxococcota bacterium]
MSSAERHAEFLTGRLRAFGLSIELGPGAVSAEGVLALAATPFETLGRPLVVARARFYTLGHNRLKFFDPAIFFDLPAVDIGRCGSKAEIESALRRAWAGQMRALGEALTWLQRLRAQTQLVAGGARLRVVDEQSGPVEVRAPRELLLPSSGALARRSLSQPGERRFRALPSLESANELALSISSAVAERARHTADATPLSGPDERPLRSKRARRVMVISSAPSGPVELATLLALRQIELEHYRDSAHAIAAFRERSYEIVLVDVRVGREDGLELAADLRRLPGVEHLPIAILDERESNTNRAAARDAGAALYLVKPVNWEELEPTLLDLLDHAARRRFERFAARMAVRTAASAGAWDELTELVARGGICLRTRRDILPGAVERYRIHLPAPLEPIDVDGDVISRANLPGYASVLAGIRFRRFLDEGESRWIRVIEDLARRSRRGEHTGP